MNAFVSITKNKKEIFYLTKLGEKIKLKLKDIQLYDFILVALIQYSLPIVYIQTLRLVYFRD